MKVGVVALSIALLIGVQQQLTPIGMSTNILDMLAVYSSMPTTVTPLLAGLWVRVPLLTHLGC